jgi:DNA-damage-inducible protein J
MSSTMIHVRIDEELKKEAQQVFEHMGLSMSEAIRLFLHRTTSEQALPFEVKVPNAVTRETLEKAERGEDVYPMGDIDEFFARIEREVQGEEAPARV